MKPKTYNQAVIEQLMADGINVMFGNPGSTEEGLIGALDDFPDFKYILALHEASAVGMASSYAKSKKDIAAVQLHIGAGLGNAIGLMWQAYDEQTPMLILAGESGIKYDALKPFLHADLVKMAEPVTKFSTRVMDAASTLRILRRAIKTALTPPMGPVFVSLPMDILDSEVVEEVFPTVKINHECRPEQKSIEEIADLLINAEKPMFLIGDRIYYSDAQRELTNTAEAIGAEVWGVNDSMINMERSHPLFKGNIGHSFGQTSKRIVEQADVILICGTYVFPEMFPEIGTVFSKDTKIIHIDNYAEDIARNHRVEVNILADIKLSLAKLAEELSLKLSKEKKLLIAEKLITETNNKLEYINNLIEQDEASFKPDAIHAAEFLKNLHGYIDENTVIYDESITHIPMINRYIPMDNPENFFSMRAGSLGTALPGTIGLKIANRDKTVIGFSGDGGSLFTIQSLWTAARYNLDSKFIIWNNGSYQILKINILQYWMLRNRPTEDIPEVFNITGPEIRFDKIAEGFGIQSLRITKPEEIRPAIEKMLNTKAPFLLDVVIFDRETNPVV